MGFYGTTTSSAKTNLQVDIIYPNKLTAKNNATKDGVYAGRYILVEYDIKNKLLQDETPLYKRTLGTNSYVWSSTPDFSVREIPQPGVIYHVIPEEDIKIYQQDPAQYDFEIWIVETSTNRMVEATDESDYTVNFNIDKNAYHSGRGWDSTLWQKIYVDGVPDYVLVAELNSVIPTFDVTIDAPSIIPQPPHFDDTHTNVYYDIHLQPQWGVRVAAAENSQYSDEKGDWISQEFNKDNTPIKDLQVTPNTPLNIYYNKEGFSPIETSYIEDNVLTDKIKFEPTGISGRWYNAHGTAETHEVEQQVDTYEMSIILPAIGNTISQVWDMVYGGVTVNNSKKRNLDINWDSYEGLRLVTVDDDGYNYNVDQINTLAGCINSVHDLMGMIIVVEDDTVENANKNIDLYDENKIYYFTADKTFRKKSPKYVWKQAEYIFQVINLTADTYHADTYYTAPNLDAIDSSDIFDNNKTYYAKTLKTNVSGYTLADDDGLLNDYILNKYYNYENQNYYLATNAYQSNFAYFDITASQQRIEAEYKPNRYMYKDENGSYIYDDSPVKREVNYYLSQLSGTSAYRYAPGLYYYKQEGVGYIIDQSENITEGRTYFYENLETEGDLEDRLIEREVFAAGDKNYYYDDDANIIAVDKNNISNNQKYYTIIIIDGPLTLYEAKKYYYKEGTTYFLDLNNTITNNRAYYTLNAVNVSPFYESGYYYYQNENGDYVIDNNENSTPGRIYYTKDFYYIISDKKNLFDIGAVWNPNVTIIPATIELGIRGLPLHEMSILQEFGRYYNTIHGLILRLNKVLATEDDMIRDTTTVQGCINTVNDIIDKFDTLIPGRVNIVDYLGRVSSADYQTDDWIDMKVDDINRMITLQHEYSPVDDTDNTKDLNDSGDTINLYTPILDAKGHVVGGHTTITTLPYGFKYITISPYGTDISTTAMADNTQDEFEIKASNEWIVLKPNADDLIEFSHKEQNITSTPGTSDLNSLESILKVPTDLYDKAGHITSRQETTYTLPYNYKTINVSNTGNTSTIVSSNQANTLVAANQVDAFTLDTSNKWITLNANSTNKTISIGHASAADTKENGLVGPTSSLKLNFGESITIPQVGIDTAGHVSQLIGRSITLPQISLGAATSSGNVLVGLNINSTTGEIIESKNYLGNLTLANYDPTNDTTEAVSIVQGDALNKALGKLQAQIAKNSTDVSNQNTDLASVTDRISTLETQMGGTSVNDSIAAALAAISITSTDESETLTDIQTILLSLLDRVIALENT